MDTLAKRVKFARKRLGLTQGEVAALCGLKQSDISKIEQGLIQKTTALVGLARALQCSPDWLDTGDGEMSTTRHAANEGTTVVALEDGDPLDDNYIQIRESEVRFAAGNGRTPVFDEVEESVPRTYRRDWFIKEGINPEHTRCFKVHGDSMESFLFEGDSVLVNLAEKDVVNGKVYALRYGDELRVKRIYKKLDGGLILHSDNPNFRPTDEEIPPEIVAEHISIIGRVRDKSGTGGL